MQILRSDKLQNTCNALQRQGVSKEECQYIVKILSKQIIPVDFEVCGSYRRGAVDNIKTVYLVTHRKSFDQIKEHITQFISILNLTDVQESANSHSFFFKSIKVVIVYTQSKSEHVISIFRYNCSIPFLLHIKKLLSAKDVQITQENLLFDQQHNRYIDI